MGSSGVYLRSLTSGSCLGLGLPLGAPASSSGAFEGRAGSELRHPQNPPTCRFCCRPEQAGLLTHAAISMRACILASNHACVKPCNLAFCGASYKRSSGGVPMARSCKHAWHECVRVERVGLLQMRACMQLLQCVIACNCCKCVMWHDHVACHANNACPAWDWINWAIA